MNKIKTIVLFSFILSIPLSLQAKTVRDIIKQIEKKQGSLPSYKEEKKRKRDRINLAIVAPSKFSVVFPEGSAERNYEEKLNKEISQLIVLSKRLKSASTKQDIWMRLAKSYSEKAALIERRKQEEYDKKLKLYLAGSTKRKPSLNLSEAQTYNRRAVQIYKSYVKNYPKARNLDEALFFLGYNNMSLGHEDEAVKYYKVLSERFPNSEYIGEANLSLGDYYFDKDRRSSAKKHYEKVVRSRSNLKVLGLYKLAWAQYKMNEGRSALGNLLKVIRYSSQSGARNKRQFALAQEAKRDLPIFYADAGDPKRALTYFTNVMPRKEAAKALEKLAYYYLDKGDQESARYLLSKLIRLNPQNEKSFDYQYALVNMQASSGKSELYERELYRWISQFGPKSTWAKSTKDKAKVGEALQKAELSLRSHVLALHKEAREQKDKYKMARAEKGYRIYLQSFAQGPHVPEMQFYYGELLYEMGAYRDAYKKYVAVKPSKYSAQAKLNAVLALEKIIPTDAETRKKVGTSTSRLPLTSDEMNFIKAGEAYLSDIKNREQRVEIKYRIASIYYSHNYFKESEKVFKEIIKEYPGTKYSQYASDLIIDSYKLKKDYAGLEKAGEELIQIGTKTGGVKTSKVKNVLEQSAFKKVEAMSQSEEPLKVAEAFKAFTQKYPASEYTNRANYNAGIYFEKAGKLQEALSAYSLVEPGVESKEIYAQSQKFSVLLYEKLGYLLKAADGYERLAALPITSVREKLKFLTNAAVIREGFNDPDGMARIFKTLKKYDNAKNTANYTYRLANVYKRTGNKSKALAHYLAFFNTAKGNPLFLVKSARELADNYYDVGNSDKANYWYRATKLTYEKFKKSGAKAGVADAAYATFRLSDKAFFDYLDVKIPSDPKKQAAAITKKLALVDKINKKMTEVINYDDGYAMVSALNRLGQSYQHLTFSILNAPLPSGLSPEELETVRKLLQDKVAPFKTNAESSYKKALEKGKSLGTFNSDYLNCLVELSKINSGYAKYRVPFLADGSLIQYDLSMQRKHPKVVMFSGQEENLVLTKASEQLSKDPENDETLFALAHFYYAKGFSGVSEIFLEKLSQDFKKTADYFVLKGLNQMLENNRRGAIAEFKKALQKDPNHVTASANLGALYSVYGGYQSAYQMLESIFSSSDIPKKSKAAVLNNYALGLISDDRIDEAVAELKAALSIEPNHIESVGNMAIVATMIQKNKNLRDQYLSQYKKLAKTQGDLDRIQIMEKEQL